MTTRFTTRRRKGLSLIEISIVVAIVGVLAALGGTMLTELVPSWRTKKAAREFAALAQACRSIAVAQDVQCRIRLDQYDPNPDDGGGGIGRYYVERGNASRNSSSWDVLPWEDPGDTVDDQTGEGTVEITEDGQDELRGVSIDNWGAITGIDGNDLVFGPNGMLQNPSSDFWTEGYLAVTFVNKRARVRGVPDDWTVLVSRGGMVRMTATRAPAMAGADAGTASASSMSASSGAGYNP